MTDSQVIASLKKLKEIIIKFQKETPPLLKTLTRHITRQEQIKRGKKK